MIKQSSFSQEWINTVSEKYQYHDRNLIEKVIRAYSLLEKGVDSFTPYSSDLEGLAELRLADTVPVRLSRLRRNNPEAYYYWVKVSELLKR